MKTPSDGGRWFEAVAVGAFGAVAGGLTGAPFGLAVPAATVGAMNGALSGWRAVYDLRSLRGVVAVALDSSWSLLMTAAGLGAHLLGAVRGAPGFDEGLSVRRNRHVYRRGFVPRPGFAITIGNVVAGAGDTSLARRRHLVVAHEDVHVWQARWFGPFYPLLYGGWMVTGAAVGSVLWLVGRRDDRFGKVVESTAYYLNPFEWWAYSRAGHWPPSGLVGGLGWRRPVVSARRHSDLR